MNKRTILLTSVLVIIIAITGTTLALLTAQSEAKSNAFVPGVLSAPIFENDFMAPHDTNTLTPTDKTVIKKVQVQNELKPHEIDAYIRVMLVPTFRAAGGTFAGNMTLTPIGNTIIVTAPNGGTITLNLINGWDNYWIYNNGYFYHKSIVPPGGLTGVLLESVVVSHLELWDTFHLEVLSDAIQSEGRAVAEAWGETIAEELQ